MAMVVRANRESSGIGGHISTYASAATLTRSGSTTSSAGNGRSQRRRHGLLPGPRLARHLRPGVPRGPAHRASSWRTSAASCKPGGGLSLLSAPVADARLLGVPHRLHGARPDHGHLPGPVQPLPGGPRAAKDSGPQGLGVPRRRRDGRAGDAGRHHPGLAREAGQPDLRDQLQPAAAGRPGARQRQDHPGAGGGLPRRRLERDQGDLGRRLGSPARRTIPTGCWSSAWTRWWTARYQKYSVESGGYIREHFFGNVPRAAEAGRGTSPTSSSASCAAAATIRRRSTPPTRRPWSTRASRR